ncbi:MAG: type II toxin-antitoxin system PemK/MazF family toxin [Acidimicrobiales bacterium]
MADIEIRRGDVVRVNLSGALGGEKQGDDRPCVVIQNDVGNKHSPLTIVAPITDRRQDKHLPVQVPVNAAELGPGGKDSVIECGHIRTVDRDKRINRKLGVIATLPTETMTRVDAAVKVSLGVS